MKKDTRILIAGILGIVVGMGVARFAFTSLLAPMLNGFLSLQDLGLLTSINYVGYLLGAVGAVFVSRIKTKVFLFGFGLFLSAINTFILGLFSDIYIWQFSRFTSGLGSAFVLIIGTSLVMSKLDTKNKTKAMGIHFSGIGFGIVFADILVKIFLPLYSWQNVWLILGIFAIFVSILSFKTLSSKTKDLQETSFKFDKKIFNPFVVLLILAYFTEGVGFVVQASFLPDIINKTAPNVASIAWLFVGIGGVFSCIVLMNLASRFGSINIIILALFLQIIGILIPTFTTNAFFNVLSGVLYGGTFIGLVALFLHLGSLASAKNPLVLMGALTTAYGFGQILAPLYSTYFAQKYNSYDYALYITAIIVFFGIIFMQISKKYHKNSIDLEL